MKTYIGIDPGQKGAIAWVVGDVMSVQAMPETNLDVYQAVRRIADVTPCVAVLEQVNAFPGQSVVSSSTFMQHFGALKMALDVVGVPYVLANAAKWQKALGVPLTRPSNGKSADRAAAKREHKADLAEFARRLLPGADVTVQNADALLLAVYCARQDWRGVA